MIRLLDDVTRVIQTDKRTITPSRVSLAQLADHAEIDGNAELYEFALVNWDDDFLDECEALVAADRAEHGHSPEAILLKGKVRKLLLLERAHDDFIGSAVDGLPRYDKRFRNRMERGSLKRLREKVNGPDAKERNAKEVLVRTWLDSVENGYMIMREAIINADSVLLLNSIIVGREVFADLYEDADPEVSWSDYQSAEAG